MKKSTKWQTWLILTVVSLTVYNIIPTLFFYLQPLKADIDESRGMKIAAEITHRVKAMGDETVDWLQSYCKLLQIKPASITSDSETVRVQCTQAKEAAKLRSYT